jgi:hypothetical protein
MVFARSLLGAGQMKAASQMAFRPLPDMGAGRDFVKMVRALNIKVKYRYRRSGSRRLAGVLFSRVNDMAMSICAAIRSARAGTVVSRQG